MLNGCYFCIIGAKFTFVVVAAFDCSYILDEFSNVGLQRLLWCVVGIVRSQSYLIIHTYVLTPRITFRQDIFRLV
jgi:hypothetical protein